MGICLPQIPQLTPKNTNKHNSTYFFLETAYNFWLVLPKNTHIFHNHWSYSRIFFVLWLVYDLVGIATLLKSNGLIKWLEAIPFFVYGVYINCDDGLLVLVQAPQDIKNLICHVY